MISGVYNIKCADHADLDFTVVLKDNDGTLVDATSFTGYWHTKKKVTDTVISQDLSAYVSTTSDGAEEGQIRFYVPASIVSQFGFKSALYDVKLKSADGKIYEFIRGHIIVRPTITAIP